MSADPVTGLGRESSQTNVAHTLDVRAVPPWLRHERIFERFSRLHDGDSMLIVTDHEPRPLRTEFDRLHAGSFSWRVRYLAHDRWEATIHKLPQRGEESEASSILRLCAPLGGLSERVASTLLARSRVVQVKRNRATVEQGIHWPYIAIVGSGLIQAVLLTPDGRELGMYEVLPGEMFGAIALADGGPSPLRYVARTENTRLLLLTAGAVDELIHDDLAVAGALNALAAQRLRSILDRFSAHAAQPITARVAQALLSHASPARGLEPALPTLREVRQVDLARAAGTGKDIVYRAIAELESARALAREHGKITHLDREKLNAFAQVLKH